VGRVTGIAMLIAGFEPHPLSASPRT
jgi:hypothetical protein